MTTTCLPDAKSTTGASWCALSEGNPQTSWSLSVAACNQNALPCEGVVGLDSLEDSFLFMRGGRMCSRILGFNSEQQK